MYTRSQNNGNKEVEYDIDYKKIWISFSELYPCIINDPVQIYVKEYINMTGDNEYNGVIDYKKKLWYINYKDHLECISQYRFFEKKYFQKTNKSYCIVPIRNVYYKMKMTLDILMNPLFLKNELNYDNNESKYIPTFLIFNSKITDYHEYKAVCMTNLLYPLRNEIQIDYVLFINVNTNEIICYNVGDKKNIKKNLLKYTKWIRNVKNIGSIYTLDPPSHPYLYPNMKIQCNNNRLNEWKIEYANKLNEITLLWKCQSRHRMYFHNKGIMSYNDPRFLTVLPEILCNEEDQMMVNKMLQLKQSSKVYFYDDEYEIPENCVLFVDFEKADDIIYWIGVGEYKDKKYKYLTFVASELNKMNEMNIMNSFTTYLDSIRENKKIIYWYAEPIFWKQSNYNYEMDFDNEWIDLHRIFRDTPILIKDCFNFKLKTIAKKMYEYKMIDIKIPEDCQNGMESIELAKKYYQTKQDDIFNMIYRYNYFDCRVMYEIMKYFNMIK